MSNLVLIDLEKDDLEIYENNCFYINFNKGKIKTINSKNISFSQLKNFDKKSRLDLAKSLKKKIKFLNEDFFQELELFNLRNDKIFLISKIMNFIKLKYFLKDKKFKTIKLITDDHSSVKALKSLNSKIIIHYKKKKKKNFNFVLFKISKFYVKALFLIIYIKLKKNLIPKVKNEVCMTIYPNFFLKEEDNFYKRKNTSLLNFLITDETHLNHSFLELIFTYNKISKSNTIIVEQFINILDVITCYFKTVFKLISLRKNDMYLKVNNLNLNDFYLNNFYTSFINRSKLEIYNKAIPKIIKRFNISTFNLYLFEYSFGFYLIKKFKQNHVYVKGYQHGIFSNKLFWFDLIYNKTRYHPNEVVSSNKYSDKHYRKILGKDIKIKLNKKKISNLLEGMKNIKRNSSRNILILPGTHDIEDLYIYVKDQILNNDKFVYFFKLHPKNKFSFKETNKIKIIKNIKNINYKKIIVSSTSTLVYDFKEKKILVEIFSPDYKTSCY